jgi:hypothetical protein
MRGFVGWFDVRFDARNTGANLIEGIRNCRRSETAIVEVG